MQRQLSCHRDSFGCSSYHAELSHYLQSENKRVDTAAKFWMLLDEHGVVDGHKIQVMYLGWGDLVECANPLCLDLRFHGRYICRCFEYVFSANLRVLLVWLWEMARVVRTGE